MSYLQDRKNKQKKYFKYGAIILVLVLVLIFQNGVFGFLSGTFHYFTKPVLITGNNLGASLYNLSVYFKSKSTLQKENDILKFQVAEQESLMADYNTILADNLELEAILGRVPKNREFLLSAILADANHSPYGTLIIDVGEDHGVVAGDRVFAWGNIPIGYIAEVYSGTSKVVLYSSPQEVTEVIIDNNSVFMKLEGRGRGNFEMILPREFAIKEGAEVSLPGLGSLVVAQVDTIITDPRDSFKKALLTVPINIFELKFVEIER